MPILRSAWFTKHNVESRNAVTEAERGKIGEPSHTRDLPLTEGSFRQTGRNLDIRLWLCEGITDP
jgi:hypothetical protein